MQYNIAEIDPIIMRHKKHTEEIKLSINTAIAVAVALEQQGESERVCIFSKMLHLRFCDLVSYSYKK
jgi:hypothetical protein